jgi:murein DD-endopeptidase MepM/ murein hydrolase activator NlpD
LVSAQSTSVNQEIQNLNSKIQTQKKLLETIRIQQKQYQTQIRAKINAETTLNNQLAILKDQTAKTQLDIDSVNSTINKTKLEVKKTKLDNINLGEEINARQLNISFLLQSLYRKNKASDLEVLLLNNSLSDFLSQIKYLNDTNEGLRKSVESLKIQKNQLTKNQELLEQKNNNLLSLKKQLTAKEDDLNYEQENKTNLLEETHSSEQEYQRLLQNGLAKQRQAESDISSAEQSIRQKMSQKDKNILDTSNNSISWPVPSRVINASFHDPDYPFQKLLGQHSGVDIRAPQGTTLLAAADGYVAKVRFSNNKNYAYIMLIHGNSLSTVYGHISAVFVTTDQYVSKGEPIGRTGGTPGSIGAGPFSTGPHLHFEVRLKGIPVNPLNYLP